MSIKGLIQRWKDRIEEFEDVKRQDRINELVVQRKKNSNERELERFLEEERQKNIKEQLEAFREKRREENRRQTILGGKNMFTGKATVLEDNDRLFKMKSTMGSKGNMFGTPKRDGSGRGRRLNKNRGGCWGI